MRFDQNLNPPEPDWVRRERRARAIVWGAIIVACVAVWLAAIWGAAHLAAWWS